MTSAQPNNLEMLAYPKARQDHLMRPVARYMGMPGKKSHLLATRNLEVDRDRE